MRPENILYGVDDRVPPVVLLLSAAQQTASAAAISFVTLLVVLDAAHADLATVSNALSLAMLGLAAVTALQCLRAGPVGSGYLVPAVFSTSFLPGMLAAAHTGGLGLVFGMTAFAGVVQTVLARVIPRLRAFFPAEITGFTVFMIGLGMGTLGIQAIAGSRPSQPLLIVNPAGVALGALTLAVMVALSVWSRGKVRTFCALLGIAAGYAMAMPLGLLGGAELAAVADARLLGVPSPMPAAPAFAPDLVLSFTVGAIACCLRGIGDITTSQKLNDPRWVRPDLASIEGGVLACGLGNVLSGLLGTIGSNSASSGIGLAMATGVTARRVGFAMAGLLAALAFVPAVAVVLAVMPRPVLGAVMVFSGCMVVMNGLQIIVSRVIDGRKTFVIGLSLMLGISHDISPGLFSPLPGFLHPFVESSTVLAIVSALLLNLVFRIGVKKTVSTTYRPGPEAIQAMYDFARRQGGAWGARRDVVERLARVLIEFAEVASELVAPGPDGQGEPVTVRAAFDEFHLDVDITYRGRPFEVVRRALGEDELLDDDAGLRLSSLLIARTADSLAVSSEGDTHKLRIRFDH